MKFGFGCQSFYSLCEITRTVKAYHAKVYSFMNKNALFVTKKKE